jgi:hypothetical protein
MRQHVANEILQTERSYVKSLTILNEVISSLSSFCSFEFLLFVSSIEKVLTVSLLMRTVQRLIQQTKRMNIMSDQEFASAFSNLPDLVEHHKKFESILASR